MKMLCTSRHLLHHLFDIPSSSRSSRQGAAPVDPAIAAFPTWPISCHFTLAVAHGDECWPDVAEDYQEFDADDLIDLTAHAQGTGETAGRPES